MKSLFAKIAAFIANVSPKVKAGLIWGALATLAIGWLNSVTPADLSWAGPAEPLLFSAIPILVGQIAAWIKNDPLRAEGAASLAAKAAQAAADAVKEAPAPVVTPEPAAAPAPAVEIPASTPAPADQPVTIQK